MSKLSFSSRLLFQDNNFNPAGAELVLDHLATAENKDSLSDAALDNFLLVKEVKDRATDLTIDLTATTGSKGEDIALQNVKGVQVIVYRTAAATLSGSVAITIPQFGITTGAISFGGDTIPAGTTLFAISGFSHNGRPVGSTAVGLDFTSPVGFAVKLLAIGDLAD